MPLPADTRPTPALLTTTLPPDSAAQANAALLEDAFHDTLEQVFGIDLASASPADVGLEPDAELAAAGAGGVPRAGADDLLGAWFRDEGGAAQLEPDDAFVFTDGAFGDAAFDNAAFDPTDQAPCGQTQYEYVPGAVAAAAFGGSYGAPMYPAPFPGVAAHDGGADDPLRDALALRYLGGIFHDSSGEASYLDPGTLRGRTAELAAATATSDPEVVAPPLMAEPDAPTEQLVRIPSPTKPSDDRAPKRRTDKSRPAPSRPNAAHATERGSGGKVLTGLILLASVFAILYGLAGAGPIALTTGSVTQNLTPGQIGDAVVIAPDDFGRMIARVDGAKLRADLSAAALAQETPAVNASYTVDSNGTPTLVPGRDGRGFPPDALASAVQAVLAQPAPRTVTVPLGDLPPAFTTADAQALGVTDVLGTTTVPVPSVPNRFANVQRGTALVAGSIIGPGETWSFLKTIGALDTANGFAIPAAAQKAGVDPSGGVDTVATAVFGAAFASGMGDTLHHPHASFVDRYPVGLDAAVVAPGTDMQWTNTGDHPVYLYASYANDAVTIALLGEKAYDQVTVQVSQRYAVVPAGAGCAGSGAVPGFQVDVSRTLMRGGAQVGGEQFHVQYVPQNGVGCPGGATGGGVSGAPSSPSGSSSGGGGGSGNGSPARPPRRARARPVCSAACCTDLYPVLLR